MNNKVCNIQNKSQVSETKALEIYNKLYKERSQNPTVKIKDLFKDIIKNDGIVLDDHLKQLATYIMEIATSNIKLGNKKLKKDPNKPIYSFFKRLSKANSPTAFLYDYRYTGYLEQASDELKLTSTEKTKLTLNLDNIASFIPIFSRLGSLNAQIYQKIKSDTFRLAIIDDKHSKLVLTSKLNDNVIQYFNDQVYLLQKYINPTKDRADIILSRLRILDLDTYNQLMLDATKKIKNLKQNEINNLTSDQIESITAYYILSNFDNVIETLSGGIIKVDKNTFGKLSLDSNKYTRSDSIMPSQVFDSVEKSQSKEDADKFADEVFRQWFYSIKREYNVDQFNFTNHSREGTYFDDSTLQSVVAGVQRMIESNSFITISYDTPLGSALKTISVLDVFNTNSSLSRQERVKALPSIIKEIDLTSETKQALIDALNKYYLYYQNTITQKKGLSFDDHSFIERRLNMGMALIDYINSHRVNRTTEIDEYGNIQNHSIDTEKRIKLQVIYTIINKIKENLENGYTEIYNPFFVIDDAGHTISDYRNIFSPQFVSWFQNAFGLDLNKIIDDSVQLNNDTIDTIVNATSFLLDVVRKSKQKLDPIDFITNYIQDSPNHHFINFKELAISKNNENKRKQLDQRGEQIPNFTIEAVIQKHSENMIKLKKQAKEVYDHCFFKLVSVKPQCKTLDYLEYSGGENKYTPITKLNIHELCENSLIKYFFNNLLVNRHTLMQVFDASDKSRQFGYNFNIEEVFKQIGLTESSLDKSIGKIYEKAFEQSKAYYDYIRKIILTNGSALATYYEQNGTDEQKTTANTFLTKLQEKSNTTLELMDYLNQFYNTLDSNSLHEAQQAILKDNPDFQFVNDRDYTIVNGKYQLNTALIDTILIYDRGKDDFYAYILKPSLEEDIRKINEELNIQIANSSKDLLALLSSKNSNFASYFPEINYDQLEKELNQQGATQNLKIVYTENPTTELQKLYNIIIKAHHAYNLIVKEASMITLAQSPLMHSGKGEVNASQYFQTATKNFDEAHNLVLKIGEARYDTSTKRGNCNVATIIPYSTENTDVPSLFLPKRIRFAVIKSLTRDMQNFQGDENNGQAAHDGASFLSGPFALMQTWSCKNGYNITGSRKNLGFGITPGRIVADKCAGYPMDNAWIRGNSTGNASFGDYKAVHNKKLFLRTIEDCIIDPNLPGFKERLDDFNQNKTPEAIFVYSEGEFYMLGNIYLNEDNKVTLDYTDEAGNIKKSKVCETLADIWEAAGSAYSMDSNLRASEGSIKYITKFMCYVQPQMKDQLIGEISLTDTIKSGATNVNPEEAWSGDMKLNYSYMPMDNYGVQNDNSHEADDSELAQPSQVISGVAFNGVNVARSSELYEAMAQLVDFSSFGITFKDEDSRKKVLSKIARSLYKSFDTSKQLSHAQQILQEAIEEEKENGNLDISFSSSEFFNKLASHMLSILNNVNIKNHFPGTAAILNPSTSIKMLYTIIDSKGKEHTITAEDILYKAQDALKGKEEKEKEWIKNARTTDELIQNFLEYQQEQYEKQKTSLSIADIHIGDNIKYKLPKARKWTYMFIESPKDLVTVNELLNSGNQVFRDITKPRDLRPLHITYTEIDNTTNIPVRRNFWLSNEVQALITAKETLEKAQNEIKKGNTVSNYDTIRDNYKQALTNYREFLKVLSKGKTGSIEYLGTTIQDVKFECGEQIIPKVHRTNQQLGEKTLYEAQYYSDILTEEMIKLDFISDPDNLPSLLQNLGNIRDEFKNFMLLYGHNENIYVTKHDIGTDLTRKYPELDENGVWYFYINNEKAFPAGDEYNYLCIDDSDPNRKPTYVIHIGKGTTYGNYLKNFYDYDLFYTSNLSKELTGEGRDFRRRSSIKDEKGKTINLDVATIISPTLDPDLRERIIDDYLNKRRLELQSSFDVSLDSVSLRIPSQSYQSFMPMKTVAFIENNTNDCYTNIWQIWFQGSDFDIDKNYTLLYGVNKTGVIESWSPLFDFSSPEALRRSMRTIPLPDKTKLLLIDVITKVKEDNTEETIIYAKDQGTTDLTDKITTLFKNIISKWIETGSNEYNIARDYIIDFLPTLKHSHDPYIRIDSIKEACKEITIGGSTYELSDEDLTNYMVTILNLIDNHNLHDYSKAALKNKILNIIYEAATDPENLEHATQPMSARPFKDVLTKLRSLAPKIEHKNMYSSFRQFDMIVKNAIGKTCVGIFANGIKVNSTLQQYYNEESRQGREHSIENVNIQLDDNTKGLRFVIPISATEEEFAKQNFQNLKFQDGKIIIEKRDIKALSNLKLTPNTIAKLFGIFDENGDPNENDTRVQEAYNQIKGTENVADALSILISLATDNAKELFLEQINCNPDTAKGLIALFSLGFTIEESLAIYYFKIGDVIKGISANRNHTKNKTVNTVVKNIISESIKNRNQDDEITWKSIQSVFRLADEMTSLAQVFSINRGVKATLIESLNAIDRIKKILPDKINSTEVNNTKIELKKMGYSDDKINNELIGALFQPFNLDMFLVNSDYQNVLRAYAEANCIINQFDVILKSPHYFSLLGKFNKCIKDLSNVTAIASYITHNDSSVNIFTDQEQISTFERPTYKQRQAMWNHYVIGNFLKDQKHMKFNMSAIRSASKNLKIPQLSDIFPCKDLDFITISLDNDFGVRKFKEMMDIYIASILKPRFKNNKFIQALNWYQYGAQGFYSINISQSDINAERRTAIMNDMKSGFKQIATLSSGFVNVGGENITIGEMLYFYDLIVNKRKLGTTLAVMKLDDVCKRKYDRELQKKLKEMDDKYSEGALIIHGDSLLEERNQLFDDLDRRLNSVVNGTTVNDKDGNKTIRVDPDRSFIWTFANYKQYNNKEERDRIISQIEGILQEDYPWLQIKTKGDC